MSSYFDTMADCVNNPKRIARLVKDQYHAYLMFVNENCATEEDEEKINKILNLYHTIIRNNKDSSPETLIGALHSLAHEVGRAGIHLKDETIAGDNPRLDY